jgi:UDP-3-O-[3-hydroxymyristoyl] glucosamine N-acyltransferase
MAGRLCGLGFSGNTLSLVFNTLRALGEIRDLLVIENVRNEDHVPYDCGLPHRRIWYEDYVWNGEDVFFFGVTAPNVKAAVLDFFASRFPLTRERFVNVIHPSVQMAYERTLATGIRVEPGCIISPFAEIGFGVGVARGASIGHHAHVGEFATINPGAHIAGHSRIGERTTIGIGAVVFDHTAVGADCLIGGGSVVNKDMPDGVVAYGNPCRVVRERTVDR